MSIEPHRNALRRIRSTNDIVSGTVFVDLQGRTVPNRNRRVFSVDGGINIAPVSPTFTAQNPPSEGLSGQTMQSINEPAPAIPNAPVRQADEQRRPAYSRILSFFGLGRNASPRRKLNIGVVQDLTWNFIQIVVIVVMLILSGTHFRSTTDPRLSEWTACDRPLGVWCTVWVLRVLLSSLLRVWEYKRNLARNNRDEETRPETSNDSSREGARSQNTPTTHSSSIDSAPSRQRSATHMTTDGQDQATLPYNRLYSQ